MGQTLSNLRKEQARQLARRAAHAAHAPKPGALVGVAKDQVKPFIQQDPNTQHLRAFDCSICKQRFVWDIREELKSCPLCSAGAHQKPNKLPSKRLTNSQRRKLARRNNGKSTQLPGDGTDIHANGTDSGAASEAQEPGSVRVPAA